MFDGAPDYRLTREARCLLALPIHEQTGLLVERDAERFAAAVQSLLANPDLAETYGRNGREHVTRNWNWDRSVSLLSSQLQSVRRN